MTLEEMYALAVQRRDDPSLSGSGTAELLAGGVDAVGKKLVEEAAESWMAGRFEDDDALALELSQVLYYVVVMGVARGLSLDQILENL